MTLYILPNTFDDAQDPHLLLPAGIETILAELDLLIAESERAGRRFLIKMLKNQKAREMPISLLNEHSRDCKELVDMVLRGKNVGLVSDAGMACIADPGADLVYQLRERGFSDIRVVSGPSSVLLALVLSGLGAQRFSFHGYLPKDGDRRRKMLLQLEKDSLKDGSTQVCIEAPYRNKALFADCLAVLKDSTDLSVAASLTLEDQFVETKPIKMWKRGKYAPKKEPMVFLIKGSRR